MPLYAGQTFELVYFSILLGMNIDVEQLRDTVKPHPLFTLNTPCHEVAPSLCRTWITPVFLSALESAMYFNIVKELYLAAGRY